MIDLLFIPLQPRLFDDFYRLRCDENNIKWTGHISPPEKEKLHRFVEECIYDEKRFVFLVYNEYNECVGFVYCDIDDEKKVIESSYGVYFPFTRKGYGSQIIEFSSRYGLLLGMKEHIAWVSEQNIPSNRVFQKNGFIRTEDHEQRNLPLLGGNHVFYKFTRKL